ncbi:MAG TPA: hypothetical protein VKF32_13665 [Thermoanaerobaculia bacterium]|nr:hypothetical protein [Thermoanaerobaculia bacterium]
MSDNEKKDAQPPETPKAGTEDTLELKNENLEKVAGGMGVSIPHTDVATSLNSLATPVCLSQT